MSPINSLKYISYLLLIIGVALYLTYPLLKGKYGCTDGEYEVHQSFMVNFIDTLKQGELPAWNEYVGGGYPAIYFGHYPITQNIFLYALFGVNDYIYYWGRFLNLIILFVSFTYAGRLLKFGYLTSLIGALIYFSINFIPRYLPDKGIENLLVYPLLIILLLQIIKDKQWKTILIFSMVYIFWLTGGQITYVYTHLIMLSIIYWIGVFVIDLEPFKLRSFKKFTILYFILFITPLLAVLYQYNFIYEVIKASNRLREGLIVSPFESIVWKQLWRSFQSSSYFWMGLILTTLYFARKYANKSKIITIVLIAAAAYLIIAVNIKSASIFADYIPLLKSADFMIALLLYLILSQFVFKSYFRSISQASFGDFVIFVVYISLLSYYFYSPENILGYDYDFFMELSMFSRILFMVCLLFSMQSYHQNNVVRITVISLIALYLIRSHLLIPLMRFGGIVWYLTRDGAAFSALFAFLFLFGMRDITAYFSDVVKKKIQNNKNVLIIKRIKYGLLLAIVILLAQDSFHKFYKGHTDQLLFPKKREEAIPALNAQLLDFDKATKHFYRIFTSKNYVYMPGILQNHKIREASIYESTITNDLKDFFEHTILQQPLPDHKDIGNVLPLAVYPKHVYAGFGVPFDKISYRDVYLIDDAQYLQNQNIEFFWDIMQVKYLVIRADFVRAIEAFIGRENYKLLGSYPSLDIYLYEITKDKRYSRFGILPLEKGEDFEKVAERINSGDVDVLRDVYARIVYLDKDNKDFMLLKSHTEHSGRYYEIDAKKKGMLIEFESWNHHWRLKVNNEKRKLYKAFTIFRGTRIEQGKNVIELEYNVPYFKTLFIVSIFTILTYAALFVYAAKRKPLAEL